MFEFEYIENEEKLVEFRKYLHYNKILKIAVDFECEFHLHEYGEKLCLIQVFDGEKYYIIDPLKICKEEIIKTLANKNIIKYMYGSESDMSLVYKQYGIKLINVFDQNILVEILNIKPNGLDGILEYLFDIKIKNKKKFQKYNWNKRLLEEEALQYALNDVRYLFKINEILMKKINEENKINELIEKFIKKNDYDFDKKRSPRVFKCSKYNSLSEQNKSLIFKLFDIREEYAKIFNMPAHNIFENNILFDIINKVINIKEIKICKKIPENLKIEIKNKLIEVMKEA
jgi:ribonuclease D